MAISFVAAGASASGTTSCAPAHPAGLLLGDILLLEICSKYAFPDTPSGWISPPNSQVSGGSGANGVDVGTAYQSVFVKVSDGNESGTITVNVTGGNAVSAKISAYRINPGTYWDIRCTTAADTSAGTGVSFTGADDIGISLGDWLQVNACMNTDLYTYSGQAISATGCTFNISAFATVHVADGDGLERCAARIDCTAGKSTAAPVFTMTASGTATDNPAGACVFTRLREVIVPSLVRSRGPRQTPGLFVAPGRSWYPGVWEPPAPPPNSLTLMGMGI